MLLYIHIPFCDSKCFYCSFNSYVDKYHLKELYVDALVEDLKCSLDKWIKDDKFIETIFIGGGTPSTLNIEHYKKIFDTLNPYLSDTQEITIEANPNSVNLQWLTSLRKLGINRISFGVQSFKDEKLNFLGRNHTQKKAIKAITDASSAGFKHINMDLIYGCENDNVDSMMYDLNIIKNLPIDHISAYSLTIEENTKFYHTPQVKIEDYELSLFLFNELNNMGFNQYEISNFSKNEDAMSKHNLGYWKYKEYIGCGSGAVGRIADKRLYKEKDIEEYIKKPTDFSEIENLSENDILVEKVLLGLRSNIGIDLSLFDKAQMEKIDNLLEENKIKIIDNKMYTFDYLIADEIALYLL